MTAAETSSFSVSGSHRGPLDDHGLVRTRAMRKAVFAAFVARASGMTLQLVSLPIAAAALGPQGFALFAMLVATMSWLSLSNLGLAPALTVRLSRLRARGDLASQQRAFSTGLWGMLAVTSAVAFAALFSFVFTSFTQHAFGDYLFYAGQIPVGLWLVIAIAFISVNLSTIEAAQTAFLEQHRTSWFIAAGTLVAAVAVLAAARLDPQPAAILLAVYLPQLLSRAAGAVRFAAAHRELSPWPPSIDVSLAPSLLRDGLRFSIVGSLNNFLCHGFPVLIIGALASVQETASFAAVMAAITIAASFFAVFSSSMLGGASDAHVRGDAFWLRRTYGRILATNIAYASGILLLLSLAGETIFHVWYQGVVDPQRSALIAAGAYLVALGIESANVTVLNGMGQVALCARWSLLKAVVTAALVAILASKDATTWPFIILAAASFALSAVPLTISVFRHLWRGKDAG